MTNLSLNDHDVKKLREYALFGVTACDGHLGEFAVTNGTLAT